MYHMYNISLQDECVIVLEIAHQMCHIYKTFSLQREYEIGPSGLYDV